MLPAPNSKKWFIIFLIYTAIIFIVFFATKLYLGVDGIVQDSRGILMLALITSLISGIGGYMGKRIFFVIFSISVFIGLIYALYAVFADLAPGWAELTSIVGYMFIVGVGFIIAANAELINYFLKNRKKR